MSVLLDGATQTLIRTNADVGGTAGPYSNDDRTIFIAFKGGWQDATLFNPQKTSVTITGEIALNASGKIEIRQGGTTLTSTISYLDDDTTWQFLMVVFDATGYAGSPQTIDIYCNNSSETGLSLAAAIRWDQAAQVGVGVRVSGNPPSASNHFAGRLEQVAFFKTLLGSSDFAALKTTKPTEYSTAPTTVWSFDADANDDAATGQDLTETGSPTYDSGESAYGGVATLECKALTTPAAAVSLGALAAPTGLSVASTVWYRCDLSWNSVAGATGYRIQRKALDGPADWITLRDISAPTVSWQDHQRAHSTLYTYRVRSVSSSQVSAPSAEASATTPAAPSGAAISPTARTSYVWNDITVTFSAATDTVLAVDDTMIHEPATVSTTSPAYEIQQRYKIPVQAIASSFVPGDTITGATSGAVGRVVYGKASATTLWYVKTSGTFQNGETINGLASNGSRKATANGAESIGGAYPQNAAQKNPKMSDGGHASAGFFGYRDTLRFALPGAVAAGESVLYSKVHDATDSDADTRVGWPHAEPHPRPVNRGFHRTSCAATLPTEECFAPPLAGNAKRIYLVSEASYRFIENCDYPEPPSGFASWATINERLKRFPAAFLTLWDHNGARNNNRLQYYLGPKDSMNNGWQRAFYWLGDAISKLLCDHPIGDKLETCHRLTQIGIEMDAILETAGGNSPIGWGMGTGQLWFELAEIPTLFAGLALGDDRMLYRCRRLGTQMAQRANQCGRLESGDLARGYSSPVPESGALYRYPAGSAKRALAIGDTVWAESFYDHTGARETLNTTTQTSIFSGYQEKNRAPEDWQFANFVYAVTKKNPDMQDIREAMGPAWTPFFEYMDWHDDYFAEELQFHVSSDSDLRERWAHNEGTGEFFRAHRAEWESLYPRYYIENTSSPTIECKALSTPQANVSIDAIKVEARAMSQPAASVSIVPITLECKAKTTPAANVHISRTLHCKAKTTPTALVVVGSLNPPGFIPGIDDIFTVPRGGDTTDVPRGGRTFTVPDN